MSATIAFLGLGAMGALMAGNLIDAGFRLRVWNRSTDKAAALAARGAVACATAAEAVRGADYVVSIVADDLATRDVMLGDQGAIAAAAPGTVIIDSSTNTPAMAREAAAAAAARGVIYLDAPVLGSLPQARGRELVFMVGGDPAAIARAKPLFDAMGRLTLPMGASGAGATIKLVNNMLSGTMNAALAEAVRAAEAAGVDVAAAASVLNEGAVASRLTKSKLAKIGQRDFSAQFQLELAEKDLRYFLSLASEVDSPAPLAALVRSQMQAARRAGMGKLDVCAVYLQAGGERP